MTNYQFPSNFWWGSAASGPQTEGRIAGDGKGENIFDYWFSQEPEKFFDQVGPEKTSQVYTKYKEDVQLMKQTGHNSFRTSIQWSRLIPEGTGEVNQQAVDFYHSYFDELIANGIEPFVNLYHFDMPMPLQEKGGWLNRETVEAGYLYRWHYPEESDMKKAIQVGYHEALASALAVKAYHSMALDGSIGIILNLTPSYPRDENNPEDVKAAKLADAFFNRLFLDPAVKGEFPPELIAIVKELDMVPAMQEDDLAIIKENTIDLLGINYYQPRRVKAKETPIDHENGPMPEDYFDNYEMPNRKMNPYRGWEIYEKGIYDILINVRDHYGNIDYFISENGMGVENEARFIEEDGMIHDDYRIEFVQEHLKYVHQAIEEGANCLGYHMWTCMDNWSWTNAYKNRYGFISVDLANDGKRTIKKSGHWFKKLSDTNQFTI